MAGRVENAQPELTQRELFAVRQRPEWVGDVGRFVEAELGAMARGEHPGARDVVGMNVGIDDVAQAEPSFLQEGVVLVNVNRWIDNRGLMRLARGNEIRRAAEPLIEDLLKVHPGIF